MPPPLIPTAAGNAPIRRGSVGAHFLGAATAATLGPPHARSQNSAQRLLLWCVIATIPALLAGLYGQNTNPAALLNGLLLLTVAMTVSLFWESLFARRRGRSFDPSWYVAPWLFVLLLPLSSPLWLAAIALSFGLLFGHHIFGGTGRSLVNPALLGVLFVHFSYPGLAQNPLLLSEFSAGEWWSSAIVQATAPVVAIDATPAAIAAPATTSALACLIGALCLVRVGAASPRTLLGALAGVMVAATLVNLLGEAPVQTLPWYWHLVLGQLAFGVAFIATDPGPEALTRTGRWIHGFAVGALTVLIRVLDPTHPDGTLFAILLAGLTVPLIDDLVVRGHLRRRNRWRTTRGN